MNESSYEKLVKEADAVGESIRTFQDEKQTVVNDFDKEKKRFKKGKISKATLQSSAKKSNNELSRLDKKIRTAIARVGKLSSQMKAFVAKQSPKAIRVKVIAGGKKKSAKKVVKKKAVKKKK